MPFQNKKGQKNLRYPIKKQSFYKETDCIFVLYLKFFGPSYFETALVFVGSVKVPINSTLFGIEIRILI